jgi:hypothetical protein
MKDVMHHDFSHRSFLRSPRWRVPMRAPPVAFLVSGRRNGEFDG